MDPLGTLGQELEIRVGVDVQNVYELSLEQGANVHPFLVHLLHSIMFQRKYNVKGINFFKIKFSRKKFLNKKIQSWLI